MKVMREEESFKPVTIVLESQLEVDALSDIAALMANYSNLGDGLLARQVNKFFEGLDDQLRELSTDSDDFMYIEGLEARIQYKDLEGENK